MVVLLVLDGEVGLAAQGSQGQQARAGARDGRDAWGLEARGVRGQLDRRAVSSVGEVLCLKLLLLQRHTQTLSGLVGKDRVVGHTASQPPAQSLLPLALLNANLHPHTPVAGRELRQHWNKMISGRLQADPPPHPTLTRSQPQKHRPHSTRVKTHSDMLHTSNGFFK